MEQPIEGDLDGPVRRQTSARAVEADDVDRRADLERGVGLRPRVATGRGGQREKKRDRPDQLSE
jgi:hypothetical protein